MIKLKKIHFLLSILIALLGYTLFSVYTDLKDRTISEFNAQQALLAKQAADNIESHFSHYMLDMVTFSEMSFIASLNEPGKDLINAYYEKHSQAVQAITRVSETGRILYTVPYNESAIGSDISGQAHIRQILETHQPVVSEVFMAVQGYRTVACHVPVFEKGEFKGSLAVLFPFHLLAEEFIKNITIGQGGYAWVISQQGVVLYNPVPGIIGKTVFEIFRNSPSAISMAQEMISGKEGAARYTVDLTQTNGMEKTVKQAVYYPIHLGNTIWSIAIATPEKEILSTMTGFRNKLLLVALLFITAASLYSFYIIQARGLLKEEQKRRQTEAALLESEKKYRNLLDDIEDGYFEVDIRGDLTFFNTAMCAILGYSPSELKGKNNREFMDTETAAKVYQTFNKVFATGKAIKEFDWEVIQKNGNRCHIDTSVSLVKDSKGQKIGFRGIMRDISDRRQAEEKMREYKNRYQALFDRSLDCVFVHDFKGKFIDANEAAIHMLGYDRKDLPGVSVKEILDKDQFPLAAEVLKDLQEHGFQKKLTGFKLKHQNGQTVDVETKSSVIYKEGKPYAIQGIARDITEKLKMEAQFRQAQKVEAIGTLAGGIAHDFNNILTAILGYTEMARYALPENSPAAAHMNQVYLAGIRARDLVKQILTFSRQADQDLRPIKIQDAVTEALTFLRASIPTTIDIRQDIRPDCGHVLADSTQIHQIIMNLCTNAYHAMRETGGVLSVSLSQAKVQLEDQTTGIHFPSGVCVQLEVSDTGTGIDRDILGKIFDPYYTTKAKGEGTGMGLAMVHGIVKSYGGDISVDSEVGKGTTFRICFPVIEKGIPFQEHAASDSKVPGGNEHILVVDDEQVVTDITQQTLESLGYQVSAFTCSEKALDAFRAQPGNYDMIISDMTMPRLNGLQLAEQSLAIRPGMPFIICTGFSDLITKEKIHASGIQKVIMKPVFLRDLAFSVRMALDNPA
ncbi:MAG: PAS domain S-box protein [Desulfobacteraceae bacterium]|nr:MAG: PAS domain S-box protein [Desulfobacteraceae bacterium]